MPESEYDLDLLTTRPDQHLLIITAHLAQMQITEAWVKSMREALTRAFESDDFKLMVLPNV